VLSQSRPTVSPAEQLRQAFARYAALAEWRWRVRITPLPAHATAGDSSGIVQPVVRIDLTKADALALTTLLHAAADPGGGRAPVVINEQGERVSGGRTGTQWITTTQAAGLVGVQVSTVRSWIARRGPKWHPFPAPDASEQRRNYWKISVVERWKAESVRMEDERRATRRQDLGRAGVVEQEQDGSA
jgi:hypothetical protein